jgi:hypothetical protein
MQKAAWQINENFVVIWVLYFVNQQVTGDASAQSWYIMRRNTF